MDSICPVCNGMESLIENCPQCGVPLTDLGQIGAFYGPYSPYREIDDIKMSNGYQDLENHQCIHVGLCPQCSSEQISFVQEISSLSRM